MNSEWNMRHAARVAPKLPHALPRDAHDEKNAATNSSSSTHNSSSSNKHIAENSNYHYYSSHHSLLLDLRFFDATVENRKEGTREFMLSTRTHHT